MLGRASYWGKTLQAIGALLTLVVSAPYLAVFGAMVGHILTEKGIPPEIYDSKTLELLWSSVLLSSMVAFFSFLVAAIVLVLLWQVKNIKARIAVLLVVGLLYCLSPIIHLIGWRSLPLFSHMPELLCTCSVLVWRSFPIMTAVLLLGIAGLDRPGLEMSVLHSGWRQVIRRVLVPRLRPIALMGGLTVFALTFMEGEVPPLIGVRVYPEEFLSRVALETSIGGVAVGALPFFLVALFALICIQLCWPKEIQYSWQQNGIAFFDRYAKGGKRVLGGATAAIVVFLVPVALLLNAAGKVGFENFFEKNRASILSSFELGIASAALTLVVAYLLVDILLSSGKITQVGILAAMVFQIFLPGSLLGLGMIEISYLPGMDWLNSGDTLLVVTHALRQLPYAILLLAWLRWLDINQSRDELKLVGVSWWNSLRHIRLPREWPRLLVVMGMVLVLALSELSSTILVVAPGTETIILRLYNLMHYGSREAVAALAFVQAVLVMLLLSLPTALVRMMHRDSN